MISINTRAFKYMFIFVDKYLMENPSITCFSYLTFGMSDLEMNMCISFTVS